MKTQAEGLISSWLSFSIFTGLNIVLLPCLALLPPRFNNFLQFNALGRSAQSVVIRDWDRKVSPRKS
ncbi:hypothetical protein Agabi119p4_3947 [Agaricus bisporus var. burnettii]|uniref:Uncharacterized protein n=1 Tax=Agaricus bisporus var. burnettii TaxID=192524 RepID=A0A8H7F5S1_AGABI|nr:hypothetical protein Agabi119p4_3947 [Agaricus bisporus var. burnettii]